MSEPRIVEAHGSYRILSGDVEIERHGDPDVAARRLAWHLEQRAAESSRPSTSASEGGTGEEAGESEGPVAELRKVLEGNVKEVSARVAQTDGVAYLEALCAVEEAGASRKTLLRAISERIEAIEKAKAPSGPEKGGTGEQPAEGVEKSAEPEKAAE